MPHESNFDSRAKQVMDIHYAKWMSMPGVEAVGVGKECIKIYFADESALNSTNIADCLDDCRIAKIVSGEFSKQDPET